MYFKKFPILRYTLDDGASYQIIQDIFRRVTLSYASKTKQSYYQVYEINDGETPEIVSHRFYKSTQYHWIILHANEIIDPRYGWCLSQEDLKQYVIDKYTESLIYGTHHYEWVLYEGTEAEQRLISDVYGGNFLNIVSNWEYEDRLNEERRLIKVPLSELVAPLELELGRLIKE
jgi:hypothetical protein